MMTSEQMAANCGGEHPHGARFHVQRCRRVLSANAARRAVPNGTAHSAERQDGHLPLPFRSRAPQDLGYHSRYGVHCGSVFTMALGNKYVADLIAELESRRTLDKLGGGRNSLFSATATTLNRPARIECYGQADKDSAVDSAVRKLVNNGLTEELEDKILAFKNILVKMEFFRKLYVNPFTMRVSNTKTLVRHRSHRRRRQFTSTTTTFRGACSISRTEHTEPTPSRFLLSSSTTYDEVRV